MGSGLEFRKGVGSRRRRLLSTARPDPLTKLQSRPHFVLFILAAAVVVSAQGGPYERQKIDPAAAKRGRGVYAQHCINCHGSAAKGTERGPDLIRSALVLRDRLGNGIGPAAQKAPSHQAKLTAAEVVDLSHFLHDRIESVATNR